MLCIFCSTCSRQPPTAPPHHAAVSRRFNASSFQTQPRLTSEWMHAVGQHLTVVELNAEIEQQPLFYTTPTVSYISVSMLVITYMLHVNFDTCAVRIKSSFMMKT